MDKIKRNNLILLFSIFVHFITGFLYFLIGDSDKMHYFLVAYFIMLLVYFVVKRQYTYLILITTILGYGIFQIIILSINRYDYLIQAEYIIEHFILLIFNISLWLFIYLLKGLQRSYLDLSLELEENRKYIETSKVLTRWELEYRLETLMKALERRKENAYIIKIKVKEDLEDYRRKVVLESLAEAWLKNIRDNYDLIGQVDENTLLVILQNSNDDGLEIVMNRFFSLLENEFSIDDELFNIYSLHLLKYLKSSAAANKNRYNISDLALFSGKVSEEMSLYVK